MQCLSLLIVTTLIATLAFFTGFRLPFLLWIAIQGMFAACFSRLQGLESWWLLIQFGFPFAVLAGWQLHLPPGVYLTAFLFCLALYWSTFRTRVPFYPSGPVVWRMVAGLLPSGPIRFADAGSGFGGLLLYLARQRADSKFIGIELAPLPWVASRLRGMAENSPCTFLRGDYTQIHFGDFDVVFVYLSPAAMPALWIKARNEMRPGSLLLSYEFAIPAAESQIANIATPAGAILYACNM